MTGQHSSRSLRRLAPHALRRRLWTLRRLPPGARFAKPTTGVEAALLRDLLALSDDDDPLAWLEAKRGDVAAQLQLWSSLRSLWGDVWNVQAGQQAGVTVRAAERGILGNLTQRSISEEDSRTVRGSVYGRADPEALRRILRSFQRLRGPPPDVSSGDLPESLHIAAQLLALPEAVDPLEWIRHEHPHAAALGTLRHLLNPAVTRVVEAIGRPLRTYFPGAHVRMQDADIVIDEVTLAEAGVSMQAHAVLSAHRMHKPPGLRWLYVTWDGFERLFDDRGYQYLRQKCEYRSNKGLIGSNWHESIEMEFAPAVASDARELTFASTDARIEAFAWGDSRPGRTWLDPIQLGELSWRMKLLQ